MIITNKAVVHAQFDAGSFKSIAITPLDQDKTFSFTGKRITIKQAELIEIYIAAYIDKILE